MSAGLLPMRPYQVDAVEAALDAFAEDAEGPAEVLPTGAGKTVIMAHLGKRWLAGAGHGKRMLVIGHRDELLHQTVDKFRSVAPEMSTGIVAANRNEAAARVVVGSIQTLASAGLNRARMIRDVGLVIADECHHAVAPSWARVLDHFTEQGAHVLGLTATMTRGDKVALGKRWKNVVYSVGIASMIAGGYLVRPRGVRVKVADLNLGKVKRTRGDYSQDELGRALTDSDAPDAIARAITEQCPDRQGVIFAPTVASAEVIAAAVRAAGFTTGVVHGAMPMEARRDLLDDFRAGRVQWLANCMVLTEGTDLPMIEVVVIARPTSSVGLYIQMVGRGLRPHPGKTEALILDVVGATQKHKLASPIDLFGEDPEERKAAVELADIDPEDLGLDEDELNDALGDPDRWDDAVPAVPLGQLEFVQVDLFRGSSMEWQQTDGGIWFLSAGDRYIVVQPGRYAGTWDVCDMHKIHRGTGRWIQEHVADLGYAMAWAERQVTSDEMMTAARDRAWKKREATDKAKNYAKREGIQVMDGMRGGELSALIDQKKATRRIDPHVPSHITLRGSR